MEKSCIPTASALWGASTSCGLRSVREERCLPEGVGKYSKRIDTALPGSHTREIYDEWPWEGRSVLGQLRTGMVRLNDYLHRIQATTSEQCACGHARETVEHFLFHCSLWEEQRKELRRDASTQRNDISTHLGGKSEVDGPDWKPNMAAVRATIEFTLATGRLKN